MSVCLRREYMYTCTAAASNYGRMCNRVKRPLKIYFDALYVVKINIFIKHMTRHVIVVTILMYI